MEAAGARPAARPVIPGVAHALLCDVAHALLRGRLLAHASHGTEKKEQAREQNNEDDTGNSNHGKLSSLSGCRRAAERFSEDAPD
jgi:hypothetical protein